MSAIGDGAEGTHTCGPECTTCHRPKKAKPKK